MNLIFPENIHHLILFQRPQYLKKFINKSLDDLKNCLPDQKLEQIILEEADEEQERVERLYTKDILEDFDLIRPYIPHRTRHILDAGCGTAGIGIHLFDFLRVNAPKITLTDSAYQLSSGEINPLPKARELLLLNGVPKEAVNIVEEGKESPEQFTGTDLILFLYGPGTVYPLSDKLPLLTKGLNPGGKVIVDIANDADGAIHLKKNFHSLTFIHETEAFQRIVAADPVVRKESS